MDLTGTWACDDFGTYFIRQIGKVIWWYGQKNGDGVCINGVLNPTQPYWSNVGKGRLGDIPIPDYESGRYAISMKWADVPNGKNFGSGELTLLVDRSGDRITNFKPSSNFSGKTWVRLSEPR